MLLQTDLSDKVGGVGPPRTSAASFLVRGRGVSGAKG